MDSADLREGSAKEFHKHILNFGRGRAEPYCTAFRVPHHFKIGRRGDGTGKQAKFDLFTDFTLTFEADKVFAESLYLFLLCGKRDLVFFGKYSGRDTTCVETQGEGDIRLFLGDTLFPFDVQQVVKIRPAERTLFGNVVYRGEGEHFQTVGQRGKHICGHIVNLEPGESDGAFQYRHVIPPISRE